MVVISEKLLTQICEILESFERKSHSELTEVPLSKEVKTKKKDILRSRIGRNVQRRREAESEKAKDRLNR